MHTHTQLKTLAYICTLMYSSFLFLPNRGTLQHMRAYEKTLDITYAQREQISALLEAAGQRWNILFYTFNCDLEFHLTRQTGSF